MGNEKEEVTTVDVEKLQAKPTVNITAMSDKLYRDNKDTADREINDIIAAIEKSAVPNNQIPLAVFKKDFVPYLKGLEPITGEVIEKWFTCAGGMFEPLDVVDENGVILTTIPPALENRALESEEVQRLNIAGVSIDFIELKGNGRPDAPLSLIKVYDIMNESVDNETDPEEIQELLNTIDDLETVNPSIAANMQKGIEDAEEFDPTAGEIDYD